MAFIGVFHIVQAALDHKAHCDHNCNVSLNGLRDAALTLSQYVLQPEQAEAQSLIETMPRY